MKLSEFDDYLAEIRACTICEGLPLGPKPILQAHRDARILIAGQAPGKRAHEAGVPWDDPSGDRLREWLGIDKQTFYNRRVIALVPMGFCYPGTGDSGDLPPRRECSEAWHATLLEEMTKLEVAILPSHHAQAFYLREKMKRTLTETVRSWREYFPEFLPMPHPSPRNNIWLKKNPWFEAEVLPELRRVVQRILARR